jgi:hypothetical protein
LHLAVATDCSEMSMMQRQAGDDCSDRDVDAEDWPPHRGLQHMATCVAVLVSVPGIEIDARDALGRTPLFISCRNRSDFAASLALVLGGADADAKHIVESYDDSPLEVAEVDWYCHEEMYLVVREAGKKMKDRMMKLGK